MEHLYFKTEAVYEAMRRLTLAQQLQANVAARVRGVAGCCDDLKTLIILWVLQPLPARCVD